MKWKDLSAGYKSNIEIEKSKTPHEILGVDESVTLKDLRNAYLRKAKIYHPDVSNLFMKEYNQEMLKLINLAYSKIKEGIDDAK